MPEFTITRQIGAPVETVWEVLNDFGDIHKWSPGVTASELTSEGVVAEGSTRHCDFAPFGGVNERIERHEPNAQGHCWPGERSPDGERTHPRRLAVALRPTLKWRVLLTR
jgi:hypothetical protein